ncbi:LOB domain-containing protein 1-like isoform X1 [Cryptomeria japonica]|uniref:LOB domain-containing protein 1-like isoform X1 n=2 Tax=Cryptomeria japonica TaxID=3369 RepID=UPI0025AD9558|nr:LOB domain-containing protein 1-like isoform X1 [Cryptomeria japonica]
MHSLWFLDMGLGEREKAEIASPCAACKILRRRCDPDTCVLAPYFPPHDPQKFATAHTVFGACNIIKMLQTIPEERRADAVSSMVYEANARVRDPVYGCAGAISQLQHHIFTLQSQLAKAQADLLFMHLQRSNLLSIIAGDESGGGYSFQSSSPTQENQDDHITSKLDNSGTLWDLL